MVKIKFCGMTREEDVLKAVDLSVDYIGFILYPKSPRYIDLSKVRELIKLANGVKKVGVFVNPSYEEIKKAIDIGLDLIQLHGEESLDLSKRVGLERVVKVFRVKDKINIEEEWKKAYAVLLDTYSDRSYGGTGKTFNWDLAKKVVEGGYKVFLSGGLNPKNIKSAIEIVRPYAVDVSSGIESAPGVKDHKKMEEFVHATENTPEN